jgi:hypothetical protein
VILKWLGYDSGGGAHSQQHATLRQIPHWKPCCPASAHVSIATLPTNAPRSKIRSARATTGWRIRWGWETAEEDAKKDVTGHLFPRILDQFWGLFVFGPISIWALFGVATLLVKTRNKKFVVKFKNRLKLGKSQHMMKSQEESEDSQESRVKTQ